MQYDTTSKRLLKKLYKGLVPLVIAGMVTTSCTPYTAPTTTPTQEYPTPTQEYIIPYQGKVYSKFVAIDERGNGVIGDLMVETRKGDGMVLVDIDELSFWLDVQHSIRTAKHVAFDYLNLSEAKMDLIYSIKTYAQIIEGQSAGAAFTVATISALQNKALRDDTIITGMIREDGTIGKVSGIIEKAKAAKEAGFDYFLVPEGQSIQISYETKETRRKVGPMEIIETRRYPVEVDVEQLVGIDIIEVKDIKQVMELFSLD